MTLPNDRETLDQLLELYDPVEPISAERLALLVEKIETRLSGDIQNNPTETWKSRPRVPWNDAAFARWPAAALVFLLLGFGAGQWLTPHRALTKTEVNQTITKYALFQSPWQKWFD